MEYVNAAVEPECKSKGTRSRRVVGLSCSHEHLIGKSRLHTSVESGRTSPSRAPRPCPALKSTSMQTSDYRSRLPVGLRIFTSYEMKSAEESSLYESR